jgi:methyl-accepting chemotaxis protein
MRVVDLKFQRNFILRFCSLVVLTAIIISAIVYSQSASTATSIFRDSRLEIVTTADFILPVLFWGSLISVVLVSIAVAVFTFVISFRISGPIARMEKDAAVFAQGKLKTSFHVRHKDQFQGLARVLNHMAKNIREPIVEAKKCSAELERFHLSDEAREKVSALKRALDKFDA